MTGESSGLRVMNPESSFLSDLRELDVDEVDICTRASQHGVTRGNAGRTMSGRVNDRPEQHRISNLSMKPALRYQRLHFARDGVLTRYSHRAA